MKGHDLKDKRETARFGRVASQGIGGGETSGMCRKVLLSVLGLRKYSHKERNGEGKIAMVGRNMRI